MRVVPQKTILTLPCPTQQGYFLTSHFFYAPYIAARALKLRGSEGYSKYNRMVWEIDAFKAPLKVEKTVESTKYPVENTHKSLCSVHYQFIKPSCIPDTPV